ncbi:MAG: hypothetical protein ACRC7O_14790, partial [Fimbriiglobus sp.]
MTIAPATGLPAVIDPVNIKGGTQPGFKGTPIVTLDIGNVMFGTGLTFTGHEGSSVRGLAVVKSAIGIEIGLGTGKITVAGNYIGVATDGKTAAGNLTGVRVSDEATGGITIGGPAAADRNVISANGGFSPGTGVEVSLNGTASVAGILIQGNRIGTTADGTAALAGQGTGVSVRTFGAADISGVVIASNLIAGNQGTGIYLEGGSFGATGDIPGAVVRGNTVGVAADGKTALPNGSGGLRTFNLSGLTVGGTAAADANVIAGNGEYGIELHDVTGANIQGNLIGTDATGLVPLPNARRAVYVAARDTAITVLIGGTAAGAGNRVVSPAGNTVVQLDASSGKSLTATVLGNRIDFVPSFGDSLDGIRFSGDVNPGAGKIQFDPLTKTDTGVTLTGVVTGAADTKFRVEFFGSVDRATLLGFQDVTTDKAGKGTFTFDSVGKFANGTAFTATATRDGTGETSRYADRVALPAGGVVSGEVFEDRNANKLQDTGESFLSSSVQIFA